MSATIYLGNSEAEDWSCEDNFIYFDSKKNLYKNEIIKMKL